MLRGRKEIEVRPLLVACSTNLLPETRDCVEGALFPVAPLPLQVRHVHLASQSVYHLFGEQVVDESSLDRAVVVH